MKRTAPLAVLALLAAGCGGSSTGHLAASAAPTPAPTHAGTSARAVYYLHDDGTSIRLYREFHPRPVTSGVIRDAVTAMLTEKAYDSDYTSLWPRGTAVRGARVDGDTAYVDLSAEARHGSAGSEAEAQSLQQLVHTVTAAAPSVKRVQLLIDGHAVDTLWGHVDTRRPIARGPAWEVLGAVWLTTPGRLHRGARFGGEATVFEATVSWEFRQGSRVVASGNVNASTGAPGRGTWSAVANVPPGTYVVRAYEASAKDGTATHVDDKPVTVV